jgi:hypothetical protein
MSCDLLTNWSMKCVIGINQDSLGTPASYFTPSGQSAPSSGSLGQYWAGPLSDGVVVGLIASNGAATLSVSFSSVPGLGSGSYSWKECYSGTSGSGTSVSISLGSHDMAVYHVYTSGSSSSSGSGGTGTQTTSAVATSTAVSSSGGTLPKYSQCGGETWSGSGTCECHSSWILSRMLTGDRRCRHNVHIFECLLFTVFVEEILHQPSKSNFLKI